MSETKNIGTKLKGRALFGWKGRHLVVLLLAGAAIFAVLVDIVALPQLVAFVKTWREKRGPLIGRAVYEG